MILIRKSVEFYKKGSKTDALYEYMQYGGMPLAVLSDEDAKKRVFNTSQNYRFSYQPIKWTFSFTFLVKFLDFLYRIFSYVMV